MNSREMHNLIFTPVTQLVKNVWDIAEPTPDEHVKAGEIDVVVAPLLCFDQQGHRVGFGKGFYDRFMARCRPDCLKVGLSYVPPLDEIATQARTT